MITTNQLKQTNLIFAEHDYLLKVDSIKNNQILLLDSLNRNLSKVDVLRQSQLKDCKQMISDQNRQIADLTNKIVKQKHKIKVRNKILVIISVVTAALGLGLAFYH